MTTLSPENIILFEQFAADFDQYTRETFGYKQACVNLNGNTLCVNRKKADLYLRFLPQHHWPPKTLVIARIGFTSQRAGHGTSLLRFLVQVSGKYGYEHVGIERAHLRENIQNFVRKYGFDAVSDESWLVPITLLSERLQANLTAASAV